MSIPGSESPGSAVNTYNSAMSAYNSAINAYKNFMEHYKSMYGPGDRLTMYCFQAMEYLMDAQQDKLIAFAQTQDVANVIRSAVTQAQNAYNALHSLLSGEPNTAVHSWNTAELNAASNLKVDMAHLKSLLGTPGMAQMFGSSPVGSAYLASLTGNINGFWANFGSSNVSKSQVAFDICSWIQAGQKGSTTTSQITDIINKFTYLNQKISGTATEVGAEVQNCQNVVQQYAAIYKDFLTTYQTIQSAFVQNQSPS